MASVWVEQVGIPIVQGAIAGGLTLAVASSVLPWQSALPLALAGGGLWMLHAFDARTPKKYRQPVFNRLTREAPAIHPAEVVGRPAEHIILLQSADGRAGNRYRLTIGQYETARQVAFHLIFLRGYLSDKYMVEVWKVLRRPGLRECQGLYTERGWMAWRGQPYGRAGMRVTESGAAVFAQLAREHIPTPDERKALARVIRGGTSRAHVVRTHDYPLQVGGAHVGI